MTLTVRDTAAMELLRRRGRDVRWIGLHKYELDGQRITLTELIKLAKEQVNDRRL